MPQTIEGAFAKGAHEMIVVLPDSKTVHNGSMYSSSVTTGDFENFVAHDVVAYIDAHYRTIAEPGEPRPRRPFHGRLWGHAHRHEARRRVRQPLHHEPVLPVAARHGGGRGAPAPTLPTTRRWRRSRRRRIRRNCRSACARSSPRRPPGRRTRRIRRSISICRSATRQQAVLAQVGGQCAAGVHRSVHRATCASIAPSRSTSAIRTACGSTPASCTTCSISYGIANTFEIYPGHAHQRRRGPVPGTRDAVLQPHAVGRAGEAMTRFALAAAAMLLALAPGLALDGEPGMHDPVDRHRSRRQVLRLCHRQRPAGVRVRRRLDLASGGLGHAGRAGRKARP